MSQEHRSADLASGVLLGIAALLSLASIGFEPFLLTPVALVLMCVGLIASGKYRRLGMVAALLMCVCFVLGAAIAVWYSRAIY